MYSTLHFLATIVALYYHLWPNKKPWSVPYSSLAGYLTTTALLNLTTAKVVPLIVINSRFRSSNYLISSSSPGLQLLSNHVSSGP